MIILNVIVWYVKKCNYLTCSKCGEQGHSFKAGTFTCEEFEKLKRRNHDDSSIYGQMRTMIGGADAKEASRTFETMLAEASGLKICPRTSWTAWREYERYLSERNIFFFGPPQGQNGYGFGGYHPDYPDELKMLTDVYSEEEWSTARLPNGEWVACHNKTPTGKIHCDDVICGKHQAERLVGGEGVNTSNHCGGRTRWEWWIKVTPEMLRESLFAQSTFDKHALRYALSNHDVTGNAKATSLKRKPLTFSLAKEWECHKCGGRKHCSIYVLEIRL